jgi:cytochrome c biogenesis factor
VDLSSVGLMMGKNSIFLTVGMFVIVFGLLFMQVAAAVFYKELIASQPWFITLTSSFVNVTLRVLFIPIITTAITSFDCYTENSINDVGETLTISIWRADTTLGCFKSI